MKVKNKEELQKIIDSAYLEGRDLSDWDLTWVNLRRIDFKGLRLYNCKFNNCSLSQANFSNCMIHWCVFNNCKMASTKFYGCSYFGTWFKRITFSKGSFLNQGVPDTTFIECTFREMFPVVKATYKSCTIRNINY